MIARGAGTEIIRSINLEVVDSTTSQIIFGVQHHIYTVLSVIVKCVSANSATSQAFLRLSGYDSKEGTTDQNIHIAQWKLVTDETFVWNDKFSFNGHEPTDFAGPMDNATKQDAIADQGSSVAQKLQIYTSHADDSCAVICTYIDQNNA
jgi:hypothetical protein